MVSRDPLYNGPSNLNNLRSRLAPVRIARTPKPQAPSVRIGNVRAGIAPVGARRGEPWRGAPEEALQRTSVFLGRIGAEIAKEKELPTTLGGMFYSLLRPPVQKRKAGPAAPAPIKNKPSIKPDRTGGPQSKLEPDYDRLRKNAATHGVSRQEFDRQWASYDPTNIQDPNNYDVYELYKYPAEPTPQAPKPIRNIKVPKDRYGGTGSKVQSLYDRHRQVAKDKKAFDEGWNEQIAFGNDPAVWAAKHFPLQSTTPSSNTPAAQPNTSTPSQPQVPQLRVPQPQSQPQPQGQGQVPQQPSTSKSDEYRELRERAAQAGVSSADFLKQWKDATAGVPGVVHPREQYGAQQTETPQEQPKPKRQRQPKPKGEPKGESKGKATEEEPKTSKGETPKTPKTPKTSKTPKNKPEQ